ncbi:MAG: hypothetical protein ACR2ID_10995 [Chthoniobacterales bacterium]
MIKSLVVLTVAASLGLISVAQARTLKLPNDEFPIASVTIPDDWAQEEVTNGISGTSPDEAVYLAFVAVGNDKGMNAEIDDTFEMLKEQKVVLDQSSKKENKFKINGLEADELLFQGSDEDGPATVSITFVPIADKLVVLTYWVTTSEEKKHSAEVGKIINSLKPAS